MSYSKEIKTVALLTLAGFISSCERNSSPSIAEAANSVGVANVEPAIMLPTQIVQKNEDLPILSATPVIIQDELIDISPVEDFSERLIAENFILPLTGATARGWEYLEDVSVPGGANRYHSGVDLNWPARIDDLSNFTGDEDFGMPVLSISDGRCVYAKDSEGEYGNVVIMRYIIINNKGEEEAVYSLFAHLNEIKATEGQVYRLGEAVGAVGKSGGVEYSHLHWEIFNQEHFNFIMNNGIIGYWSDREYIARTHQDPLEFLALQK